MSRLVDLVSQVNSKAGAKLGALEALYAGMDPAEPGGHRPLTKAEAKVQRANALTVEQLQLVQQVEHGTYRAVHDIPVGGVVAFRAGHAVPVTAVEREGYDEQGLVEEVAEPVYRRPPEPEPDDDEDSDAVDDEPEPPAEPPAEPVPAKTRGKAASGG